MSHKFNTKTLRFFIVIVLILNFYFFCLSKTNFFQIVNLKTLDLAYKLSHETRPLPETIDKITIISIDDSSAKILNKRLPWDRMVFVDLLKVLRKYEPKVIALDVAFIGESNDPSIDKAFVNELNNTNNVILASYFSPTGEYIKPIKIFADSSSGFGFINKPRDKDLVVRSARAAVYNLKKRGEVLDYSFVVKTICSFLDLPIDKNTLKNNKILLRKQDESIVKEIPVDSIGTVQLKFRAKFKDFNVIPLHKVIRGDFPEGMFKDKIVMVGLIAEIHHDIYPTPIGLIPGPAINSNEILMVLDDDFISNVPRFTEFIVLLLLGLLTALYTLRLAPMKGFCLTIVQIALLIGIGLLMVFRGGWHARYFDWIFIVFVTYFGVNAYKYLQLIVESITLKTQAVTDGLTGLFVFRYFELRLQSEWDKSGRTGQALTLVMVDIDHFKKVNDTYGHNVGNVVLKQIAQILSKNCRKTDVACRYGGEEFSVIMANTSTQNALIYAKRVVKEIEETDFMKLCGVPKVTLSMGVATVPDQNIESWKQLIESADKALYHAKETGRNRTCIFEPNLPSNPKK